MINNIYCGMYDNCFGEHINYVGRCAGHFLYNTATKIEYLILED